jgi:hypothetical protein
MSFRVYNFYVHARDVGIERSVKTERERKNWRRWWRSQQNCNVILLSAVIISDVKKWRRVQRKWKRWWQTVEWIKTRIMENCKNRESLIWYVLLYNCTSSNVLLSAHHHQRRRRMSRLFTTVPQKSTRIKLGLKQVSLIHYALYMYISLHKDLLIIWWRLQMFHDNGGNPCATSLSYFFSSFALFDFESRNLKSRQQDTAMTWITDSQETNTESITSGLNKTIGKSCEIMKSSIKGFSNNFVKIEMRELENHVTRTNKLDGPTACKWMSYILKAIPQESKTGKTKLWWVINKSCSVNRSTRRKRCSSKVVKGSRRSLSGQ